MSDTIRIITEPSVYLVGRQQVDEAELSRFLADEGVECWTTDTDVAGQKLVEVAGRCCYWSFAKPRPGGNAAHVGHLLDVGHGSVLEHCVFNLIMTGVSRSFTHELVRHRAGFSFSQLSQRFVDESKGGLDVVLPPLVGRLAKDNPWLMTRWQRYMEAVREAYDEFSENLSDLLTVEAYLCSGDVIDTNNLEHEDIDRALVWIKGQPAEVKTAIRKSAREAARSVLPNATETKIFVTANARALRTFLELRGSRYADAEMRNVALAILRVMRQEAPDVVVDISTATDGGDGEYIVVQHHKV